jgi:hypothetical protein
MAPHLWLFSPKVDVASFAGTALASLLLAYGLSWWGVGPDVPPVLWLLSVVLIDVAHVWSTLFRVYVDRFEVRRRLGLYWGTPVAMYGLGVSIHLYSGELFWRVLAYVAVWHFIRQQMGFMALYGRRAGHSPMEMRLDQAALLAATVGPMVWWHANLPRPFWWFREGDFVDGLSQHSGTWALVIHGLVLTAWVLHAVVQRRWHWGKSLLLAATWVSWFVGIVWAKSDLMFTVMNVALHGVPYLVLLHRYAHGRWRLGWPVFLGVVWLLALTEEWWWDRLVWHEHSDWFGSPDGALSSVALSWLVPLLALPQTTHYVLDGFVWKSKSNPGLTQNLGW